MAWMQARSRSSLIAGLLHQHARTKERLLLVIPLAYQKDFGRSQTLLYNVRSPKHSQANMQLLTI